MNELVQLELTERRVRRRLAAIVFVDVLGYSRLLAVSEENTVRAWRSLRQTVIEPRIISWRGRVIDRAGDGIFAEFGSALEALDWAMDVQTAADCNSDDGEKLKLRIAVHLADVIDGPNGEVQGDGVNTAARLQTYADAGGVLVSRAVVDAVRGKTDAAFTDLGLLQLKNLAYPVHAFRLNLAVDHALTVPGQRRRVRITLGAVAASIVLMLAGLGCYPPGRQKATQVLQQGLAVPWHTPVREQAERLLHRGLAIKCPSLPCGREWLEQSTLYEQAIAIDSTLARPYAEAAYTYVNFVSADLR